MPPTLEAPDARPRRVDRGPAGPPIVCGVDRSPAAEAAALLGAALARRVGLPLAFVHAAGRRSDREAARSLLARLRTRVDAPHATLHVDRGPAPELLLDAAGRATLLVLGGPDGTGRCAPLRGRVRSALARRAPCPQLIVPPGRRLGGTEVVCGVRDWADVASARVALCLARTLGLELTLIHVLSTAASWKTAQATVGVFDTPWDDDAAHRLLDAVATAVGAAPATRVVQGPAGRALAREAAERDAATLVVGAPTQGAVGSALTGSAAAHLLRRAGRPLVVCPVGASEHAPLWPPVPARSAQG